MSFLERLFGANAPGGSGSDAAKTPGGQAGAAAPPVESRVRKSRLRATAPPAPGADPDLTADLWSAWTAVTARASVELTPTAGPPGPLDSKIGGRPYLAPGQGWPRPPGGGPELFLLAQINLGQLPPLEGFPERGLIQFFIGGNDTHGMDYRNPADGIGHLVVAVPDPPADGSGASGGPDVERAVAYMAVPFTNPDGVRLAGRPVNSPMPPDDFRFEAAFAEFLAAPANLTLAERLRRAGSLDLRQVFASGGHRLGGYPRFAHDDPRLRADLAGFATLLLQVDSDESAGIDWGDGGACGFFIEPERLAALDLSRTLYWWDCL